MIKNVPLSMCTFSVVCWGRLGHDHIVVGSTTTFATSARSWQGVLNTALCDKVCQWLVAGQWFSQGTPVSSTIKIDHHDSSWFVYDIDDLLKKIKFHDLNIFYWSKSVSEVLISDRTLEPKKKKKEKRRSDITDFLELFLLYSQIFAMMLAI